MNMRDPGDRRLLDRRYRVGRVVAVLPLGRVVEARHIGLDAVVALTELRPPAETPPEARARARARCFAEARRFTTLAHPGLPRVHDYFNYGDACLLVGDFVEGETLSARIQRAGPISVRTALGYALQLCDVLAYLHRQQPPLTMGWLDAATVRITPEDRAVPVDLGIARRFEQALRGDPPSPEAPQDDVVAIGRLLLHMLRGERTPAGTDPDSVQNMGPRMPEVVSAIIRRALEQAAPNALTSVAEMGYALQAAAHALFGPLRHGLADGPAAVGVSGALAAQVEPPTLGMEPLFDSASTPISFGGQRTPVLAESAWQASSVSTLGVWQAGAGRAAAAGGPRRHALMGLGAASVALAAALAVSLAAGMPSGHTGNAQPGHTGAASPRTIQYGVTPQPKSAAGQLASTPPSANPPVRQQIQPPTPTNIPPTATAVPTHVPTATPLATVTPTPTFTPTPSVTPTPSATPSVTPLGTPSVTPTVGGTPSTTPATTPATTPTPLPIPSPPLVTPTVSFTPVPTPTPILIPMLTPTPTSPQSSRRNGARM